MKYIFCLSYLTVPRTITLIEQSLEMGEDFCVIASNKNLLLLIEKLYGKSKTLKIPHLSYLPISKRFIVNLPRILYYKFKLRRKAKTIRNSQIYFFIEGFSYFELGFIKELAKYNQIFHERCVNHQVVVLENLTLRMKINITLIKLIYSIEVFVCKFGELTMFKATKSFLESLPVKSTSTNVDKTLFLNRLAEMKILSNANIMLLGLSPIDRFCNKNECSTPYRKIVDIAKKYKALLKLHPACNEKIFNEGELEVIPNYLPANLIISYFKVVIGYASATLFEAANDGVAAISLVNYLPAKSEVERKNRIRYIDCNLEKGKKVYYPNTFEEIEELVKAAVRNNESNI